jgi:ABC-type Fe3+ transport system permease subunit
MLLVVHGKRSFGLYESFDKTLAVLPYFLDLFGARTVARCVFSVAVDASSASGSAFTGAVLACAVTTSDYIGTVLLRVAVLLTFVAAPYFPICATEPSFRVRCGFFPANKCVTCLAIKCTEDTHTYS